MAMSRKKGRRSRGKEEAVAENPFDELAELIDIKRLPEGPAKPAKSERRVFEPLPPRGGKNTTRGRIDVLRSDRESGWKGSYRSKRF